MNIKITITFFISVAISTLNELLIANLYDVMGEG
jgi:hypothetical protein